MKKIFIISAFLLASLTAMADEIQPRHEEINESWMAFCQSRGYEASTQDPEIIDEYLDTWVGSTEEESALSMQSNPSGSHES